MTAPKPGEPLTMTPERVAELRTGLLPDAFGLLALCDSHEVLRDALRLSEHAREQIHASWLAVGSEAAHWMMRTEQEAKRASAARAEVANLREALTANACYFVDMHGDPHDDFWRCRECLGTGSYITTIRHAPTCLLADSGSSLAAKAEADNGRPLSPGEGGNDADPA